MKQVTNFCPVMEYEKEILAYPGELPGFCRDNHLDGVELYLYGDKPFEHDYRSSTVGVHLKYWPTWLDFWRGNQKQMAKFFPEPQARQAYYSGATDRESWLEAIRKNIRAALTYEPEYLVWHVSECDLEAIFTRQYRYTNLEVLQATLEVYHEVADLIPSQVQVLFENLWWPGLTLLKVQEVDYFFNGLLKQNRDNVGIMLDTGHLLNTNVELQSEEEGLAYILQTVKHLGPWQKLLQGLHLSCSLSGKYQKASLAQVRSTPNFVCPQDSMAILKHITSIDQHRIFRKVGLAPLLDLVQPRFVNHELYYDQMSDLALFVAQQQARLQF